MPLTVLVVDDEVGGLTLASLILQRKMGFNVIKAQDGENGFEIAKRELPDLIISDDFMPKMHGLEMLKKLRNEPTTAHIPCILIYINTSREKARPAADRIEDAVLSAPYRPDHFIETVKTVLERRGLI